MYSIQGNIHDRYTLEFKIGFSGDSKEQAASDFRMDTWVFLPDTLGINQSTYTKERFYRDFRSMLRLITPVYTLRQIASADELPQQRLSKWCNIIGQPTTPAKQKRHDFMYEHQVKMFCAIVRAAFRDEMQAATAKKDLEERAAAYSDIIDSTRQILAFYRSMKQTTDLRNASAEKQAILDLGDEFLSRNTVVLLYGVMERTRKHHPELYDKLCGSMVQFVSEEVEHQQQCGYLMPKETGTRHNREFLFRKGQLKKYVESDLWLLVKERSNTFLFQQFVFMIAAGVSMVFATVVSFSFQQTYGNFTAPLFIALVISYMFKDRTKELLRIWFATKLGSYMYEYKTNLEFSGEEIGCTKTGMDFVHFHKLPREVLEQRGRLSALEAGTMAVKEKVIIFRQKVSLYNKKLAKLSHYPLHGVNEILRINLREFLRRMDASHAPLYIDDGDGNFHTVQGEKVYYVHFVMRIRYQDKTDFKLFRVCLHRRGAATIEES